MLTTNAFAEIGSLIGDPGRASMLIALMDGRALTATELAAIGGVTPQTASSHLARLVAAGLLAVERQGRHRYHRLATPAIASLVENLMTVVGDAALTHRRPLRTDPREAAMRQARTCYDHLAGSVAVAITDAMLTRGDVQFDADGGALTVSGAARLSALGVVLPQPQSHRRRIFCRPCLDWSERRTHIAGAVGAALLDHMLGHAWIRKAEGSRAVVVTPAGRRHLTESLGLGSDLWCSDPV